MNVIFTAIAKSLIEGLRIKGQAIIYLLAATLIHSKPLQALDTTPLPEGMALPHQRQVINNHRPPWVSIGNISINGRRFCTALLIADDVVATAAHCLHNPISNDWYPPEYVNFLAGYRAGDFVAHRRARRLIPNPRYRFREDPNLETLANDWALVQLREPLELESLVLAQTDRRSETDRGNILLAGYRGDSRELLTLDNRCGLLPQSELQLQGLLSSSCDGFHGDSGGALLRQLGPENFELLGLHVGRVNTGANQTLSLAVPAAILADALQRLTETPRPD
ncbi:trypsin-like serine protease [Pseudomaricurvus alkylphenolicus]|uniref:trypsin-like serine peptidase n=1 Tax=Pseudomaricurvus alkylphenolicus TaxID=1306991 RepID=UPI0014232C5B|nr:trypsin-like serine protease [Pseudomaricurvus alkylphenolicus]NIB39191.1 trypsin-like serine protease [Pseudomaricurvus alkylphenolicus]